MRATCLLSALLALVICSSAQGQTLKIFRDWGEEQATGSPDTRAAGDIPTAWASATAALRKALERSRR